MKSTLNSPCPACNAAPNEACETQTGKRMTFTHPDRPPAPPGSSWQAGWSKASKPVYDDRWDMGRTLALVGAVLWGIAVVVYFWQTSRQEDDPFTEVGNAVAGFVWGGIIFAFGCFVMLCGVVFMAGAQRTDR
jgi:hypothetical protein